MSYCAVSRQDAGALSGKKTALSGSVQVKNMAAATPQCRRVSGLCWSASRLVPRQAVVARGAGSGTGPFESLVIDIAYRHELGMRLRASR